MAGDDKYFGVFPTRLRGLIESRKTTITALANVLKISRQSVSQYQDGTGQPNVDKLCKIAQHFNVSTDYLVGLSSIPSTNNDTRDICEKTGLSEHTVSRLMQDDKRDRWAEVIDQLVLHPGVLDALHAYLFFDVDYFATVEDGKASDDHRKVMVLGDSAQGKVVPVYPRMMDGALQLEVQRELSDIKRQLKKARADHAKEKG
mgnify:CR=1 FL=1